MNVTVQESKFTTQHNESKFTCMQIMSQISGNLIGCLEHTVLLVILILFSSGTVYKISTGFG